MNYLIGGKLHISPQNYELVPTPYRISSNPDMEQAVILAGGKGVRLRPLTHNIPKVMVDINGKPLLEYILKLLRKKGISRILLLVSHLSRQVEAYFGNGSTFGLDITYAYENPPRGTGGALKKAAPLLDEEFLLLYGDTYLDFDYHALKNKFRALGCAGLICVYPNKDKKLTPNLLLADDQRVIQYSKTSPRGLQQVDAGVSIFKKEVLRLIPPKIKSSFENRVYKKLIRKNELYGFPTSKKFLDIGSPERLLYARKVLT